MLCQNCHQREATIHLYLNVNGQRQQVDRSCKYQPVGGAYKFCNEEAQYLSSSMSIENDDRVPVNKTTKNDYRLLVKDKYLRAFVKRFDITEDRENGSISDY